MKHFRKSLSALLVTAAIAAAAVVPALAAGTAYTPVEGTNTSFTKYLVLDADTTVPNATMSFTLAAGSAVTPSAGKLPVYAGDDATRVGLATGATSTTVADAIADAVGTATFAPSDDSSATTGGITKTVSATDKTTTIAADSDATKKHVSKTVAIDLSELTFNEPGIYRYVLTENASTDPAITIDTTTKTLDVYVQDASTTGKALEIAGYVMYNGAQDEAPAVGGTAASAALDTKDNTFVNTYDSCNLTVSKTVTGNQGSRDEYFKITVVLDGVVSGNSYIIDLSNADATTVVNGINTTTHTNPAAITATGTTVTQEFWLQSGQSIVVQGIGKGISYTVTEDYSAASTEGYTVSAIVTGDTTDVTNTAGTDGVVTDTGINLDTTVAYTNNKEGVIPTGILISAAPVIIIGVVVVAGIAFFAVRGAKRKAMEAAEADSEE